MSRAVPGESFLILVGGLAWVEDPTSVLTVRTAKVHWVCTGYTEYCTPSSFGMV